MFHVDFHSHKNKFSTSLYISKDDLNVSNTLNLSRRHSFSVGTVPEIHHKEQADRELLATTQKNNEKLVQVVNALTNKLSKTKKI